MKRFLRLAFIAMTLVAGTGSIGYWYLHLPSLTPVGPAPAPLLSDGQQAITYCREHATSYVVVITPRGYRFREWIKGSLPVDARLIYSKDVELKEHGPANYVRATYNLLSDRPHGWVDDRREVARQAAKRFTPGNTLQVLVVDAPTVDTIINWKRWVRKRIGRVTVAIHATDTQLEAEELSTLLLDDEAVVELNERPFLTS